MFTTRSWTLFRFGLHPRLHPVHHPWSPRPGGELFRLPSHCGGRGRRDVVVVVVVVLGFQARAHAADAEAGGVRTPPTRCSTARHCGPRRSHTYPPPRPPSSPRVRSPATGTGPPSRTRSAAPRTAPRPLPETLPQPHRPHPATPPTTGQLPPPHPTRSHRGHAPRQCRPPTVPTSPPPLDSMPRPRPPTWGHHGNPRDASVTLGTEGGSPNWACRTHRSSNGGQTTPTCWPTP